MQNYREIPALVSGKVPFNGNSMSAVLSGDDYLVLSYRTVIAIWSPGSGWDIPDRYYSNTTSRHQNICRKVRHWDSSN